MVRTTEHAGEKWINLADLRKALRENKDLLVQSAAMFIVGRGLGHDISEATARVIGNFIAVEIGDLTQSDPVQIPDTN